MPTWQKNHGKSSGGVKLIDEDKIPRRYKRKREPVCKALECRLCSLRYTRQDVLRGVYNIETFVCSFCYATMQDKPYEQSCFGKPTVRTREGKVYKGYEPDAVECSQLCPDRVICARLQRPDLLYPVELIQSWMNT